MKIYIDGACNPNPGKMGIGVYFEDGSNTISDTMGNGTNNEAEYLALLAALTLAKEKGLDKITICSDSMLLINQMNGIWAARSETSKKYIPKVNNAIGSLKVKFLWVPREANREADLLSKLAITEVG